MKKKDYIDQCRWYQHRERLTDGDARLCEFVERWWVEAKLRTTEDDNPFTPYLIDYENAGLSDFEQFDDTPLTLKAILFNRWKNTYELGSIEEFKRFYSEVYMR